MKQYLLLFGLAITLLCTQEGGAQPRNYIQAAYVKAGGSAALKSIPGWRVQEKQLIKRRIGELPEAVRADLLTTADRALTRPWTQILLSHYREYQENGNRVNFENLYFARRTKLSELCAGELVSGQGKYLPEIVNGLTLILEESTWVLPAHHTGERGKKGPDPANPLLDLFTAETAAQLAWINLLLNEELNSYSPTLTARIAREIRERVSRPYLKTNDYWWMGFNTTRKQNNWNIWINSNMLKIAALSSPDETERDSLIQKVVKSADKFLDTYPEDGGCDEGPAYWSAAGGALGEFTNLLSRITGGQIDWRDNKLIHNIGTYIYKVHIDSTRFVNFADAPGHTLPDPGRVYNFGEMFDDDDLRSFASYLANLSGSSSRMLGANSINVFASNVRINREMLENPPKARLPLQSWLSDLEVLNVRSVNGSSLGMTFMAKGGNNGESHNHNDLGNFMLYQNGSPVLIDLGKGTYTKQTFGPDRYKLWYNQSQWHNTFQVNGMDQEAGEDFKAENVTYQAGKKQDILKMELAKAYPQNSGIGSWNRGFEYDRGKGTLTVTEVYEINSNIGPIRLFFIACRRPELKMEGNVRLWSARGTEWIDMSYDPALFTASIEEKTVDDPALKAVWGPAVYRIVLVSKETKSKGSHQIKFQSLK